MSKTLAVQAAIASLVAFGSGAVQSAVAAEQDDNMEQCAGVIRGGMNDCATSSNACHGHVKEDGNPEAWIYVPKGTCDRIVGARIVKVVDPTPKKS